MDLDAYVDAHRGQWRRLEELCERSHLGADDVDELLDLYQRTGTHLSVVRSASPDPAVVSYLSWLLVRARTRTGSRSAAPVRAVGRFFAATFPAALYRYRAWWLGTLAVNVALMVGLTWWFLAHPQFEAASVDAEAVRRLVEHDFADYYSEYAASSFAFQVWVNNAWIAAQCIAFGVLGAPVVYVLWTNVLNVAFTASIMIGHGRGDVFFGLITPHGLLELTAVFVAGGFGLRLFWAWVAPGARTRAASVAAMGRTAVGVAGGLVVVLLISGAIEGFVTPSALPTWARIAIGVAAEAAFFAYVFGPGRRAAHRGVTGDVTGAAAESTQITAA